MANARALPCPPDASAWAPAERVPWRAVLVLVTCGGLLSAVRLLTTYRMVGFDLSWGDAIGSGLMEWWLWLPFVPLCFWLAARAHAARWRPLRVVGFHAVAGVTVSLCHLTAFAVVSAVVRNLRFGDAVRIDLVSPIVAMLAPGAVLYGLFVVGWWWYRGRAMPHPEVAEPVAEEPELAFRAGRGQLHLRASEIDWIQSAGNYLELHTPCATHLVRETLKSVQTRLGEERFVRIHRSTLVRRAAISAVDDRRDGAVVLADGTRLAVGKTYRARWDRGLGG